MSGFADEEKAAVFEDAPRPSATRCSTFRRILDILTGAIIATAIWAAFGAPSFDWKLSPPSNEASHRHKNYFPGPGQVDHQGPTPTGKEPFVAATAPAQPALAAYFPLIKPHFSTDAARDGFNPLRSWGSLSPFHSLPPNTFGLEEAEPGVPDACKLTQVHLLHRHGARYPTEHDAVFKFVKRLKKAKDLEATGDLAFLNGWKNKLGAEILTPFGRHQLFTLGTGFRQKYGQLLPRKDKLVFRTTSQNRMVYSALNFAAGFFGLPFKNQYHQLISIEAPGFNNTLAPYYVCNNSFNPDRQYVSDIKAGWSKTYLADAVPRIQANLEGFNLSVHEVVAMQDLCAYETVSLGYSAFCGLFTREEFEGFAYLHDLQFWYGFSFGSPTAAAQGVGWVQELVARLTKTPIEEHNTTTNSTLDDNDITFPLDQPIYVDATHDTVISAVAVALNLTSLASQGPLPTTHIPKRQSFRASEISPFAANLQLQRVKCDGKDRLRFLLNDAPIPLSGVEGCGEDAQGFCSTKRFVRGMRKRIAEIDFKYDCFGHYDYKPPTGGGGITDGQAPRQHRVV